MVEKQVPDVTFALDDVITTPHGPIRLRDMDAFSIHAVVVSDDQIRWRVSYGLQNLARLLEGGQTVGDLDPEVFSEAYYRAVDQHRYMGSTVADELEGLIELLPEPAASEYVRDWPADERDIFRNGSVSEVGVGGWDNFDDRRDLLTRHRKEKIAAQIVDSEWFMTIAPEAASRLIHAGETEWAPESKALKRAFLELRFDLDQSRFPSKDYGPSDELIERAERLLRGLILPDTPSPATYPGKYGIGFSWGPQNNRFLIEVRDDQEGKYWDYYLTTIIGVTEDRGTGEPPYHRLRSVLRDHLNL